MANRWPKTIEVLGAQTCTGLHILVSAHGPLRPSPKVATGAAHVPAELLSAPDRMPVSDFMSGA